MQTYRGITPEKPRNHAKILYILTENKPRTTLKLYESLTKVGKFYKNGTLKSYKAPGYGVKAPYMKVNNYITIVI